MIVPCWSIPPPTGSSRSSINGVPTASLRGGRFTFPSGFCHARTVRLSDSCRDLSLGRLWRAELARRAGAGKSCDQGEAKAAASLRSKLRSYVFRNKFVGKRSRCVWFKRSTPIGPVRREGSGERAGRPAQTSGPLQAQQSRAATAGVSPPKVEQEVRQPALAVSPANNAQLATSTAPATTARPVKRPHPRQASNRSEKSALALMTLRTIEFPDGRRVTQLIPYRYRERALAFQPDE